MNYACEYLNSCVSEIKGVGKNTALLLRKADYCRVADILFAIPYRYIARQGIEDGVKEGTNVIATVRVLEHKKTGKTSRVIVEHSGGKILDLLFFQQSPQKIFSMFPIGAVRTVIGTITIFRAASTIWQIVHPEIVRDGMFIKFEPVYHSTAVIKGKLIQRLVSDILPRILGKIPEWNSNAHQLGWPSFAECLKLLHQPTCEADLKNYDRHVERLAYDELLAQQLARKKMLADRKEGISIKGDGSLTKAVLSRLSFSLTHDQEYALQEIMNDQASPYKMFRLLLGDVGSGKTIVALLAMLNAVESGHQAAMLVPTEMLAHQHFNRITSLLDGLGVNVALLVGRCKISERRVIENRIASGEINILIGAHGIFQDSISYSSLGLCVIDEQHRFGVEHRQLMVGKGSHADILLMSATPIPRSMVMLNYSHLSCSQLNEKPSSRGTIKTVLLPYSKLQDIIARLTQTVALNKSKVYWVCPLIEESETLDLASIERRLTELQARFGSRVGIVHRRISTEEREDTIARFLSGEISILLATTVVEVGIDVPDADIMIIEEAHRFGLAQLHQLRGRVARGIASGSCVLLHRDDLDSGSLKRLQILRETEDGFQIAERDLEIRGGGDLFGFAQSGRKNSYKFFDFEKHRHLIANACQHATEIMHDDQANYWLSNIFARSTAESGASNAYQEAL